MTADSPMPTAPPASVDPGWYPDENPYLTRYWSGVAWTTDTAVRVFPTPEPLPTGRSTGPFLDTTPGRVPVTMTTATPRRARVWLVAALLLLTGALVLLALALADQVTPTGGSTSTSTPTSDSTTTRSPFKTCAGAKKAGAIPLVADHPRWNPALDPDGDGVACDR